ncbi:MAG: rhomboid family intramembrane serine protease, partial [Acetivibrio ethanolgignens]
YRLLGITVLLVGASGAVYALLFAYAVIFPRNIIYIWGIIPVAAPLLVFVYALIEITSQISGGSGIQELTRLTNDQIMGLNQSLCLLDEIADIIIIDTGAGIGDSVMEFACTGDETILVVTPEPTSITDAYAVLKALDKRMMGKPGDYTIKMLANRVGSLAEGRELYEKLSVVVNKFLKIKVEFLGAVPQDNLLSKAVLKQSPVSISFPKAASSQSLFEIASMIGNNKIKEQKTPNGIRLLFYNLIQSKMGR